MGREIWERSPETEWKEGVLVVQPLPVWAQDDMDICIVTRCNLGFTQHLHLPPSHAPLTDPAEKIGIMHA